MKAKHDVVILRNTLLHSGIVKDDETDIILLLCQDEDLLEYANLIYTAQAGEERARRGRAILTTEEIAYIGDYVDVVREIFYRSSEHGVNLPRARSETLSFIREFGIASWALCTCVERTLVVNDWLAFKAGGAGVSDGNRITEEEIRGANFVYAVNDATGEYRLFPKRWFVAHNPVKPTCSLLVKQAAEAVNQSIAARWPSMCDEGNVGGEADADAIPSKRKLH